MTESNSTPPPPDSPPPNVTPPPVGGASAAGSAVPPPIDYAGPAPKRGPAYTGPAPTKDDQTMAMLAHLLGIVLGFLGPLIIWLIKKDQSPFVDDQGKEALNFQISLLIAHVIAGVLWTICIGVFITAALVITGIIFSIIGAMAANKGEPYRYPLTLRLIK